MDKKNKLAVWILGAIVVVLLIALAYLLFVKPYIFNKELNIYNIGQRDGQIRFLNGMAAQIQQNGFVQIRINNNTTLYLAPFNPKAKTQQPAK